MTTTTDDTFRTYETALELGCERGDLRFSLMAQERKHPAKLALRKWLSANGVPSTYAARLSFAELENAWNDTSDASLNILRLSQGAATSSAAHAAPATPSTANPFEEPMTIHPHTTAHTAPASTANPLDGLMAYINANMAGAVNEDRVRAIVEEALSGVAPRAIEIISDMGMVRIEERTNPVFDRVLKLIACGENVLIVGPAGCGKTHLVEQVAKALDRRFGMLSGSAGASESQIMGWLLPSDNGKFAYQPSEFIELYEGGNSIFLFDEYDAFDGNMLLCANSALANGHITVPQRLGNQRVNRGANVGIVATANTYGTGADPIYSGRNQLDGATLDRFIVVEMTYDEKLETEMAMIGGLYPEQLGRFHRLRDKVAQAGLLRVISTRALKKTISNMRCGMDFGAALQDLTTGWSADEKQRVGF
jgi:cobaltochelatase CobS